jgi:hypothetical protein
MQTYTKFIAEDVLKDDWKVKEDPSQFEGCVTTDC